MATYNSHFRYNPPRRKKQRYALMERVVDFSNLPVTAGTDDGRVGNKGTAITKAWASGDILEVIRIRAGQTVLGVQVEVMSAGTAGTSLKIGDGDFDARYGVVSFGVHKDNPAKDTGWDTADLGTDWNFTVPKYYSTTDTIDLTVSGTITAGKVRLIVHLLEDDR